MAAKEKFITGIYDYVFKKLFGQDEERFKSLVELVTKEELKGKVEYNHVSQMSGASSKAIEADIVASFKSENGDKEILVDLEAQSYDLGTNLIKRQIHYAASFMADMYKKGSTYNEERQVIVIFIHKNKLNNGIPLSVTRYTRDPDIVSYKYSMIYDLYIEEYKRLDFNSLDKNDKMIVELVKVLTTEDLSEYLNSSNKLLKEVAKTIMSVNKDKDARIAALMQEKAEQNYRIIMDVAEKKGIEKGLAKGLEQGREEGIATAILSMNSKGYTEKVIADALDLDLAYVKEILKK